MLEDEPHSAGLRGNSGHVLAVEVNDTFVGTLEPGDHAQERRLAAPARAEQCGERARRHLHGNPVERREVAEPLDDVAGVDHRVSSFGFSAVMRTSVVTAISASTTAAA